MISIEKAMMMFVQMATRSFQGIGVALMHAMMHEMADNNTSRSTHTTSILLFISMVEIQSDTDGLPCVQFLSLVKT